MSITGLKRYILKIPGKIMVPTLEAFKQLLLTKSTSEIAAEVVLSGDAKHVSKPEIEIIRDHFCAQFALSSDDINFYVVGSAKMGFSISEYCNNLDLPPFAIPLISWKSGLRLI